MSKAQDDADNLAAYELVKTLLNSGYTLCFRNCAIEANHQARTVTLYPRIEAELSGKAKPRTLGDS